MQIHNGPNFMDEIVCGSFSDNIDNLLDSPSMMLTPPPQRCCNTTYTVALPSIIINGNHHRRVSSLSNNKKTEPRRTPSQPPPPFRQIADSIVVRLIQHHPSGSVTALNPRSTSILNITPSSFNHPPTPIALPVVYNDPSALTHFIDYFCFFFFLSHLLEFDKEEWECKRWGREIVKGHNLLYYYMFLFICFFNFFYITAMFHCLIGRWRFFQKSTHSYYPS
ncbi:unnamed protein product [Vicia faba]|uniref:Uncharacterized protein n=1 Tax=Vicia faba TaxID=3906 RepID=A0AAV1AGK7_VICFA|nr:unnamed protein product [Vicia faba]